MKKFLSLVMTLAMAVSLFAFTAPGAGAKDFTDSESITNRAMVEAADVISAIEVMDGYSDNSFKPQNPLTRQAAAKIICNMILGPTTAKALPTNQNPFPDVQAGSEFAGYIAYCSDNGIISGYADGTFRGGDPLSGYAFLKMLLGALRYDSATEGYVGANWRVNVAKRALGIGLDRGLGSELDGSRVVTREEAALYACNTLKADLVEYENKNTTIIINGNDVTTDTGNKGTAKAVTWENSRSYYANIAPETTFADRDSYIQFAEQYFNRLEMTVTQEGDFGRPSRKWVWKGVEIGTYPEEADKVYYGSVAFNEIYNDLNMSGEDVTGIVFVNGVPLDPANAKTQTITTPGAGVNVTRNRGLLRGVVPIKRSNDQGLNDYDKEMTDTTKKVGQDLSDELGSWGGTTAQKTDHLKAFHENGRIGDGTIVEVYRNDDINAVTICVISVYPGQVTNVNKATSKKDAYVVVEGYDRNNIGLTVPEGAKNVFQSGDRNEFETTDFAEDDIVWFTYSDNNRSIVDMHKMTSVEGAVTRRVINKSVTLSGTTYNYGKLYAFDTNLSQEDLYNDETFIVHMDGQGYALWIESAEFSSSNYALLTRITSEFTDNQDKIHTLTGLEPIYSPAGAATDTWNGNRAHLVFADGTERNVDLDDDYIVTTGTGNNQEIRIDPNFSLNQTLKIVRYRQLDDGTYRLYNVNNQLAQFYSADDGDTITTANVTELRYINPNVPGGVTPTAFRIADKTATIRQITKVTDTNGGVTYPVTTANTDSKTIFVVKDGNNYKVYTGVRNAPNVVGNNAAAYCYYTGEGSSRVAKLVFVTNGTIQNNSKDITFIAAKSASGVVTSNDTKMFREFNAVVKGEIQTIMVSTSTILETNLSTLRVQTASDDYEQTDNVILNSTTYDTDDIMTAGSFSSTSISAHRRSGVKRVTGSSNLIELGNAEYEVAADANMFFVDDDGNIERYSSVSTFVTDGDDIAYFTYDNEDGVITNLYVCEFEVDADANIYLGTLQGLQFVVGENANASPRQDISVDNGRYTARAQDGEKFGDFAPNDPQRIEYAVELPGNTPDGTLLTLIPGATTQSSASYNPSVDRLTCRLVNGEGYAYVDVTAGNGTVTIYTVHFYLKNNDDSSLKNVTITGANIARIENALDSSTRTDGGYNGNTSTAYVTYDVTIAGNEAGAVPSPGDVLTVAVELNGLALEDGRAPTLNPAANTITLDTELKGSCTFTVTSAIGNATEYTINVHT